MGREIAVKGLQDMVTEQQRSNDYVHKVMDIPLVNDTALHRALIVMSEKLYTKMTIEEIALSIGVSRRHLDRKFLARFKVSAFSYYQEKKLNESKWLLKNTQMPVANIAFKLGFENVGHFRRQFKKRFGVLPSYIRSN